ncbi:HTH-type transcriptional activator RhaR [compost metagenome]
MTGTEQHMETPEHYEYRVEINPYPYKNELNVMFVGAARPYPLHQIGPAVHDYILIHSVDQGGGRFEWEGHTYRIGQGDTFVIFPGGLFSYQSDETEPWSYRWIAIQGQNALDLLATIGITPSNPVIGGADAVNLAHIYEQAEQSLAKRSGEVLTDLEAGGWLRILLAEFARLNADKLPASARVLTESEHVVEQAVKWFRTQYMMPVSIGQLAASLGYHRTHFTKIFRQITGHSPMQYVQRIRMERAKELLHTSLTVEQVAASCGFQDPLYFSRQFKSCTGQSPTQFRDQLRTIEVK